TFSITNLVKYTERPLRRIAMLETAFLDKTAIAFGIYPAVTFLLMAITSRGEPWRFSNLLIGFISLGLAFMNQRLFLGFEHYYAALLDAGKLDPHGFRTLTQSASSWGNILFAINAGLGICMIGLYLTQKPPSMGRL
ncbi:hypothetical protein, partial [Halomonas sp. BC04]|uniref:hypothetical protein n=1 Tax=Halomonas sp. BC04 TaxID=1403540 RepID=UPI0005BC6314